MANRMTVHMDEKPVYDILLEQDFSALPKELESFHLEHRSEEHTSELQSHED